MTGNGEHTNIYQLSMWWWLGDGVLILLYMLYHICCLSNSLYTHIRICMLICDMSHVCLYVCYMFISMFIHHVAKLHSNQPQTHGFLLQDESCVDLRTASASKETPAAAQRRWWWWLIWEHGHGGYDSIWYQLELELECISFQHSIDGSPMSDGF